MAGWFSAGGAVCRHRAHVQTRLLTHVSAAAASSCKCAACPLCPPPQMIARLGKEINHPDSIYYWAWKNDIPVFCPALTGGRRSGWVCVCLFVCLCRGMAYPIPGWTRLHRHTLQQLMLSSAPWSGNPCRWPPGRHAVLPLLSRPQLPVASSPHTLPADGSLGDMLFFPLSFQDQHSKFCCPSLACRRLPGRHALLPHLQEPGAGAGHCAGALLWEGSRGSAALLVALSNCLCCVLLRIADQGVCAQGVAQAAAFAVHLCCMCMDELI